MRLDAEVIRRALTEAAVQRLGKLEVFDEIESTNTYLMRQPGPAPGQFRVAATDNQTAGRGRHGPQHGSPHPAPVFACRWHTAMQLALKISRL